MPAKTIKFVPIAKGDLLALVRLFNAVYQFDEMTTELLHEKIFLEEQYSEELNIKVVNDDELLAFASGFIRDQDGITSGWLKLFACRDQPTLGSYTTSIFQKYEALLLQKGAKRLRIFDTFPNYFLPGIDPRYTSLITLVESAGYRRRRDNVNMIADLESVDLDTTQQEERLYATEKIEIRRGQPADLPAVQQFIRRDFPLWGAEVNNAYRQQPVAIHLAFQQDEIIAFSGYQGNNFTLPWFGPMGTTNRARGKGIGGILLKRCLQDLHNKGFSSAIIPWVGPIGFYFREVGAVVERIFWNYVKDVDGEI